MCCLGSTTLAGAGVQRLFGVVTIGHPQFYHAFCAAPTRLPGHGILHRITCIDEQRAFCGCSFQSQWDRGPRSNAYALHSTPSHFAQYQLSPTHSGESASADNVHNCRHGCCGRRPKATSLHFAPGYFRARRSARKRSMIIDQSERRARPTPRRFEQRAHVRSRCLHSRATPKSSACATARRDKFDSHYHP